MAWRRRAQSQGQGGCWDCCHVTSVLSTLHLGARFEYSGKALSKLVFGGGGRWNARNHVYASRDVRRAYDGDGKYCMHNLYFFIWRGLLKGTRFPPQQSTQNWKNVWKCIKKRKAEIPHSLVQICVLLQLCLWGLQGVLFTSWIPPFALICSPCFDRCVQLIWFHFMQRVWLLMFMWYFRVFLINFRTFLKFWVWAVLVRHWV